MSFWYQFYPETCFDPAIWVGEIDGALGPTYAIYRGGKLSNTILFVETCDEKRYIPMNENQFRHFCDRVTKQWETFRKVGFWSELENINLPLLEKEFAWLEKNHHFCYDAGVQELNLINREADKKYIVLRDNNHWMTFGVENLRTGDRSLMNEEDAKDFLHRVYQVATDQTDDGIKRQLPHLDLKEFMDDYAVFDSKRRERQAQEITHHGGGSLPLTAQMRFRDICD